MIGDKKSGDFNELIKQGRLGIVRSSKLGSSIRSLYFFRDGVHIIIVNENFGAEESWKAVYEILDEHSISLDGTEMYLINSID